MVRHFTIFVYIETEEAAGGLICGLSIFLRTYKFTISNLLSMVP